MIMRHPAPLRAIPYGAPHMENRVLRVPMHATYGGTDTPLVEIPQQVLFSFTVHFFTDPGRPAEWMVGTMEGALLVMCYARKQVVFRAPSSVPQARYESDPFAVEEFLVMDRYFTKRLLYDMALAS